MLFMIGSVQVDVRPFNVDQVTRSAAADLAEKATLSGRKPIEFMGPGEDTLTLSGQLLPSKLGGLNELETVRSLMEQGAVLPVMRGDGSRLGSYMITRLREAHRDLLRDGVGFTIRHTITLKRVPDEGGQGGRQTVPALLNLFDYLGGL